jgi:hypothetical protein
MRQKKGNRPQERMERMGQLTQLLSCLASVNVCDRWVELLERMENGRFPREALHYLPKGRRYPGRPRDGAGTGSRLNLGGR